MATTYLNPNRAARRYGQPSLQAVTRIEGAPQFGGAPLNADVRTRTYLGSNYLPAVGTLSPILRVAGEFNQLVAEHGYGLYDRMLEDAEVTGSFVIITSAVTTYPTTFKPSLPPDHAQYEEAVAVAEFANWCRLQLRDNFASQLEYSIRDALKFGSSVCEINYDLVDSGKYKGLLAFTGYRNTSLCDWKLVIDANNRPFGVTSNNVPYGTGDFIIGEFPLNGNLELHNLIPMQKLQLLTWNNHNNQALGTSLLNGAFPAWYAKQCAYAAWDLWLKRMSGRFVYAVAPQGQTEVCLDKDNPEESTIPITDYLANLLETLDNLGYGAFPHGTTIDTLEASPVAEHLQALTTHLDSQIRRAIELQTLASGESMHQTRSASASQRDILSLRILHIKRWVRESIRAGWLRAWTIMNFGADNALLTPVVDNGDGDGFAMSPFEVAQLAQVGVVRQEQLPAIWNMFDLPQVPDHMNTTALKTNPLEEQGDTSSMGGQNVATNNNGGNNGIRFNTSI